MRIPEVWMVEGHFGGWLLNTLSLGGPGGLFIPPNKGVNQELGRCEIQEKERKGKGMPKKSVK